jgi:hypothetical protein
MVIPERELLMTAWNQALEEMGRKPCSREYFDRIYDFVELRQKYIDRYGPEQSLFYLTDKMWGLIGVIDQAKLLIDWKKELGDV